jgi:hypothetical protein
VQDYNDTNANNQQDEIRNNACPCTYGPRRTLMLAALHPLAVQGVAEVQSLDLAGRFTLFLS